MAARNSLSPALVGELLGSSCPSSPALPSAPSRTSQLPQTLPASGSLGHSLVVCRLAWRDCRSNRWSRWRVLKAQVATVTVQQIKGAWVSEKPLSQIFFFLAAPASPKQLPAAAAAEPTGWRSLWTLAETHEN